MTRALDRLLSPQLARFLAVGVLSAAVDVAALVGLRDGLDLPLWLATVLALSITLGVNFGLNAGWVFDARGGWVDRARRYGVLVSLNYLLTTVIVVGLAGLGFWYVAAKVVSLAFCAVVNFLGFRHWVFAPSTPTETAQRSTRVNSKE